MECLKGLVKQSSAVFTSWPDFAIFWVNGLPGSKQECDHTYSSPNRALTQDADMTSLLILIPQLQDWHKFIRCRQYQGCHTTHRASLWLRDSLLLQVQTLVGHMRPTGSLSALRSTTSWWKSWCRRTWHSPASAVTRRLTSHARKQKETACPPYIEADGQKLLQRYQVYRDTHPLKANKGTHSILPWNLAAFLLLPVVMGNHRRSFGTDTLQLQPQILTAGHWGRESKGNAILLQI